MARLLQREDVNRCFGARTSGLATRYDLGSARNDVGRLICNRPVRHDGADVPLYDLMQEGAGVLLDASPGGRASQRAVAIVPALRCVAVRSRPSLLVRPDACIAQAGEDDDTDGLEAALCRWFGHHGDRRHGA